MSYINVFYFFLLQVGVFEIMQDSANIVRQVLRGSRRATSRVTRP